MIRACDIFLSLLLILCTLPLFLLLVLLLVVINRGGVFYVMERSGRGGRVYRHVKFRTMRPGPEVGRVFFEQGRITRAGRVLRALHLDELPELWLVLVGKMSFVGPRPLPARLLAGLDSSLRQTVRPGWTGPAQLFLLRRGRLDKQLQIRLDNQWVRRRSLRLYLLLLAATFCAFFFRRAAPDLDPAATAARRRFGGGL